MKEVYIIGAMRSPIASVNFGRREKGNEEAEPLNTSSISSLSPEDIAVQVLQELFRKSRVKIEMMDIFSLGSAISKKVEPALRQAPAKHIIRLAGRAAKYPLARSIEKACSTGLAAIWHSAKKIMLGKADVAVAGGVDMMSRQPNSVIMHGLTDPNTGKLMVVLADQKAQKLGFTRKDHDEYAFLSYQWAKEHQNSYNGYMIQVINPYTGEVLLKSDEEIDKYWEKVSPERMGKLRSYPECEIMTILNSSKYGDAAGFLALASKEAIDEYGLRPLAKILSFSAYSMQTPEDFIIAPVNAILKALNDTGLKPEDIDVYENNEAFPTSSLYLMRELGIPREKVNPWGGAIAHGHPIGASGGFLPVKSITIAKKGKDKKYIAVSLCNATSEATALIIENLKGGQQ